MGFYDNSVLAANETLLEPYEVPTPEWTNPTVPTVPLSTLQAAGYYSQVDYANAYRINSLIETVKKLDDQLDTVSSWIRNMAPRIQMYGDWAKRAMDDTAIWDAINKRAMNDDIWRAVGDLSARVHNVESQLASFTNTPQATNTGGDIGSTISAGFGGFGVGAIAILGLGALIFLKAKKD